ncbi:hypothetical protein JKP88DRAFT_252116 [Tribonema minus]|uniref:ubiquitinyl hydrolase 1 n=1 Tax=Tribonema minus TaxID=303371 RepID=A0A835ZBD7_9STRA|nr:hypothetical protein JKP88DRAFT_252116 [Tribonema minus]
MASPPGDGGNPRQNWWERTFVKPFVDFMVQLERLNLSNCCRTDGAMGDNDDDDEVAARRQMRSADAAAHQPSPRDAAHNFKGECAAAPSALDRREPQQCSARAAAAAAARETGSGSAHAAPPAAAAAYWRRRRRAQRRRRRAPPGGLSGPYSATSKWSSTKNALPAPDNEALQVPEKSARQASEQDALALPAEVAPWLQEYVLRCLWPQWLSQWLQCEQKPFFPQDWVDAMGASGLEVRDTDPDGNCLYSAVADQVYDKREDHAKVRQRTMDHMAAPIEYFREKMDDPDYLQRGRKNGCWGDHIEISAIEEIFDRPVLVYDALTGSLCPEANASAHAGAADIEPIRLAFVGNHYGSVRASGTSYALPERRSQAASIAAQIAQARAQEAAKKLQADLAASLATSEDAVGAAGAVPAEQILMTKMTKKELTDEEQLQLALLQSLGFAQPTQDQPQLRKVQCAAAPQLRATSGSGRSYFRHRRQLYGGGDGGKD